MNAHRLPLAVMIVACAAWIATPAHAQHHRPPAPRHGGDFNPYFTLTDFQNNVEIDDESGLGFRFGYLVTPHHEIEFSINGVGTEDRINPAIDVDVSNLQIGYLYNFTKGGVVPYVGAGLGVVHTDDSALGEETDQVLGLCGGVRLFLGPMFHLRFDYRYTRFEGDGVVYANGLDVAIREYSFGVGWRVGIP